ncbi:CDP-alcohol phosphatidyltransferase family protein [Brevibacillus humidisoli]|uniref:CDP-alcohol phosphatidyltransferase family protein n=1 Tax=Brevibacillus humidisoli TaxID=2895522 RepID=UPI001E3FE36A|nr:CDP-alcohol phosphatidyltransferase family protein [Brevibacillus humidisoli]UFJ42509.1 CDP-alcohol phosphatidyltransferase family protein [Brevibacillus humidisoli]
MGNQYPTLAIDDERWLARRRQVQKPWDREEFWSFYVTRRLSIYVSWWLAQRTAVSPNSLTVAGILSGLTAAAFFMAGSATSVLLGCFFYQLAYLFDCLDGEVARFKGKTSSGGLWLDIGLNYALYISFFGIVYGLFHDAAGAYLLYVSLFAIFAEIMASDGSMLAFPQSNVTAQSVSSRKKSKWLDGVIFLLLTATGFQFGLFLFGLIWFAAGVKWPILVWTLYHLIIAVLRALYKIKLNLAYLK